MRDAGYLAAVVEKFNHHAKVRQDLFGVVDVLAIGPDGTLAVQATSYSNVSSRVRKIAEHENTAAIREAGWRFEVHGWRKVGGRWTCRVVDVS